MTITEIEDQLPWGFHDAYLERLEADWVRRRLTLQVRVMVSERQDLDRRARLLVEDLAHLIVEPPAEAPGDSKTTQGLWIDSEGLSAAPSTSYTTPASGYFWHRFFVHSTSSSIYICGRTATFEWIESSPADARGQTRALYEGDVIPKVSGERDE